MRCLLLLALWSVALPAVRRDLALRASVSLRRIQPGRGRDWLVACRRQPGTARATPSPHCATFVVTPCTHNPLGAKGCGEAGAIGAPPAMMNAVRDALAAVGVKDMQMPASPHRVWQAIQAAKAAA